MEGRDGDTIVYMVTDNCNLRCKYCYIPKDYKVIEDKVIDDSIPFVESMLKKNYKKPVIAIFGGEPLMYFDKVKRIVNNIKQLEKKYGHIRIIIFTNALLLKNEILDYIVENNISLNLSLDGCKESHNINRIDCRGNGSYDIIFENIKKYYDITKKQFMVKYVINPQNVHFFYKSVEDFYNMGIRKIYTSYARNQEWSKESLEELDKQLSLISNFFIENFKEGDFLDTIIFPIIDYTYQSRTYCGAGINEIVIDKDGSLYPCPYFTSDIKFKIGDIYNGVNHSLPFTSFIMNYTAENFYTKCKKCDTFNNFNCIGQCIAHIFIDREDKNINCSVCEVHKITYRHSKYIYDVLSHNKDYQSLLNLGD